jgi:hypothetical protein
MRRRRLLLLGVAALALLGLAALLFALFVPRPGAGITRENFERIRTGMTEREVEGILGARSGDYSGGRAYIPASPLSRDTQSLHRPLGDGEGDTVLRWWAGEEVAVYVWFDWRAQAMDKMFRPVPPGGSLLDRLRRLLHL